MKETYKILPRCEIVEFDIDGTHKVCIAHREETTMFHIDECERKDEILKYLQMTDASIIYDPSGKIMNDIRQKLLKL